jgi:peroxiredoxin
MSRFDATVSSALVVICLLLPVFFLPACGTDSKQRLATGDVLPPFTAKDLNGDTISLDANRGRPVILRFFLVDCKFCIADTPAFNSFYNKYREKGLQIIYINNDAPDAATVRNFAEKLAIRFPVIADPEGRIAAQYRIKAQPLTLLLDPEHRLLAALLGGVSEAELEHIMAPYLTGKQETGGGQPS